MMVTDGVVTKISSCEKVVMKRWLQIDVVTKMLVVNNFPKKIDGEIPGYMNWMKEMNNQVNSCIAMLTTPVAGVSL